MTLKLYLLLQIRTLLFIFFKTFTFYYETLINSSKFSNLRSVRCSVRAGLRLRTAFVSVITQADVQPSSKTVSNSSDERKLRVFFFFLQ